MIFWKRWIQGLYFKYVYNLEDEIPKVEDSINGNEVLKILLPHCKKENIFLSDPSYLTTSRKEGKKFSQASYIHTRDYTIHLHDCDNYSLALTGYWSDSLLSFAFGIAWSDTHAFNIMIDNKKEIWIIEPQTNSWMKLDNVKQIKKYYPFKLILL